MDKNDCNCTFSMKTAVTTVNGKIIATFNM